MLVERMTVIGAQIYKDCSLDVDLGSNSLSLCFSSILNVYLSWEISSEWYLSTISDPYCSLHNFDSLFIQISSFEFLFMFLFFNFPLLWLPWFWRSILFINHKEKIEPWTRGSRTYALTGRDFVHKHFIFNLFFFFFSFLKLSLKIFVWSFILCISSSFELVSFEFFFLFS